MSSTCRFMRNLLLSSAFSTLSFNSRRGINHVLSKKQRKKLLGAPTDGHQSPFLASLRSIYITTQLTRTQDYVIRFNLPLMSNLTTFRGRYRADHHAMRAYAILRTIPSLKRLYIFWQVGFTTSFPEFKDPPACALTTISTSGRILEDLLGRPDSPCLVSFQEFWISPPLPWNEAVSQLSHLGPFPHFQSLKIFNTVHLNPQVLWNLFRVHPSITSAVFYRAMTDPLTKEECICLPRNLRVLFLDQDTTARLVYNALEKHRGEDGQFVVPGSLVTALSQCTQLEELTFTGKINVNAPLIALFKSLVTTSRISLTKLSLSFFSAPPLTELLNILVPLLHEPLARDCEMVSVTTPASATPLIGPNHILQDSDNEEKASKILESLEKIGDILKERVRGVPLTRLVIQVPTPLPVEFRRLLGSDDWILPLNTYDKVVKEMIEAKYGSLGIRFQVTNGGSAAPRVQVGKWAREYFTTYHDVIPFQDCISRYDGRMRLEDAD